VGCNADFQDLIIANLQVCAFACMTHCTHYCIQLNLTDFVESNAILLLNNTIKAYISFYNSRDTIFVYLIQINLSLCAI